MKKTIIIGSCIIALLAAFISSGFVNTLLLFLVVGVVPGTNFALSAGTMLAIITTTGLLTILPVVASRQFARKGLRLFKRQAVATVKHLPLRRYSQV